MKLIKNINFSGTNLRKSINLFSKISTQKHFCELNTKSQEELKEVRNIEEFKLGMNNLNEGKFDQAEYHFKESLKILKNINQTESLSYIYILRKYVQTLFFLRKLDECDKTLKASIELSKIIFKANPELTFPYYRNMLAFYTYSNISKASTYVESLLEENKDEKLRKYFTFSAGAIKLLNNEYKQARGYMNDTMSLQDLPSEYQSFNLHNLAVLNLEMKRDFEMLETEEMKSKWKKDFNFSGDLEQIEKESFTLFKQSLAKLEINDEKNDKSILKMFLQGQTENPLKEEDEEVVVNSITNSKSGLTITNLSEMFFEKGKEKERQTAFWLKAGIKHYEKYEKENIARHLIIFALFYSQLGQTMYAEGLYRKSIELLKNNVMGNMNYNLVFAMNMYGRLLLRMDKREAEGKELLQKSDKLAEALPFWYHRMCKTRYLDFDFD